MPSNSDFNDQTQSVKPFFSYRKPDNYSMLRWIVPDPGLLMESDRKPQPKDNRQRMTVMPPDLKACKNQTKRVQSTELPQNVKDRRKQYRQMIKKTYPRQYLTKTDRVVVEKKLLALKRTEPTLSSFQLTRKLKVGYGQLNYYADKLSISLENFIFPKAK